MTAFVSQASIVAADAAERQNRPVFVSAWNQVAQDIWPHPDGGAL